MKKSVFIQYWVCQECDFKFTEKPEENCPICSEFETLSMMIDAAVTLEEYKKIKVKISKFKSSILQFDLYNKINRKKDKLV